MDDPLRDVRSVAVFRALQLGDLLCAVPALRALRAALPRARITLVGLPWAADFVRRFRPLVDDFAEFPGWPGLPERPVDTRAIPAFLADMQSRGFDLAVQLHGSGPVVNEIVSLLGARHVAGFHLPGQWCPDPARFVEWPARAHEIRIWTALMAKLGAPDAGEHLDFPLRPADGRDAMEALRAAGVSTDGADTDRVSAGAVAALHATGGGSATEVVSTDGVVDAPSLSAADACLPGGYAIVHPGSQLPSRRWPPGRFARVADALVMRGLTVLLTGSAGERPLTRAVADAMRWPAIDLAGRTTLGAVAALIRDARLLVANDTGVGHVAVALGTPSLIVSSGADVSRWAPLDAARHRVLHRDVPCRPCGHAVCPMEGHPCATGVDAEGAIAQALAMLDRFAPPSPSLSARTPAACAA